MNGQEHIPADLLDTLLNVNSIEQAENIVQQYLPEEGGAFYDQQLHYLSNGIHDTFLMLDIRWR